MSNKPEEAKQFVISAHVVRQLGEQLVSDEVTALIELVKNAYDADAGRISIVVDTNTIYTDESVAWSATGEPPRKGYVLISDTGTGMDEADVTKGWLHISFSAKRGVNQAGVLTPRYRRSVLGSKGVGRLSAQRIGNSLDLYSLKEYPFPGKTPPEKLEWKKASQGIHVGINWNDFQENVPLQDVPVFFESWQPKTGKPGTKLVITDLQNPNVWQDETSRSNLVGTLAQLISPFEPAKSFRINLKINNTSYDLFELTKGVRDTAISTYKFDFDGQQLHIHGKVKASLFRGGNTPQEALDYQTYIAADGGDDFFAYLSQVKGISNLTRGEGKAGWYFEYDIVLQLASLGLEERVVAEESNTEQQDSADELTEALIASEDEDTTVDETIEIVSPGPFHGEIDQLAYENAEVDNTAAVFSRSGDYKTYVKRQAGIRIYRDGFGIRPYGIDGDDWMGFQAGTTSGKSFYGLRPKNLIGYVSLTAKDNGVLEEKTDREGFVLNPASRNFFVLSYRVRDEINGVLTRVRRRFNEYKKEHSIQTARITSPTEVLANLRSTATQVSQLHEKASKTNLRVVQASINRKIAAIREAPLLESNSDASMTGLLQEAEVEFIKAGEIVALITEMQQKLEHLAPVASYLESQLQYLDTQLSDFSELAGLGLTAEALSHEIGNIVDRLLDDTKGVTDFLRRQKDVAPEVLLFTERVRTSLHALRRQTQHLDPSLRYLREKREKISLAPFLASIQSFYESKIRFQEAGIKFLLEVENETDFTLFCSRGKLTQVLDNIIINSDYWLREAKRQGLISAPRIMMRLSLPILEISDNGLGVDPGIVAHLFQPFVTTKPREVGRGLGLFITQQLLESMGCAIDLLPTLNRFQRPFIFRLDLTGALYEPANS